jgi:hypothetical protein
MHLLAVVWSVLSSAESQKCNLTWYSLNDRINTQHFFRILSHILSFAKTTWYCPFSFCWLSLMLLYFGSNCKVVVAAVASYGFHNLSIWVTVNATNQPTLWRQNLKVHHRIHNSPPLVPTLSQLDPIYTPPANLPKIHSDPIYALVFQVVSFLLAFPSKPCTHVNGTNTDLKV